MERTTAIKTLGKMLGKGFGYRINTKAPTREQREVATDALPSAIEDRNKLKEQRDARYKALLLGDAEFQRLDAAAKSAGKRVDELSSIKRSRKITVGTSRGMFFMVSAEGDTWEEIIDKLKSENKKAA